MSINKHIPATGLVLNQHEGVLIQKENVDAVFKHFTHSTDLLKGEKNGDVYLTNERLIFVNKKKTVPFHDINMPFPLIKDFDIHQPTFGANHLRGRIVAEENGGWEGSATFDFTFKKGGAIDVGKQLVQLATSPPRRFEVNPYLTCADYDSPQCMTGVGCAVGHPLGAPIITNRAPPPYSANPTAPEPSPGGSSGPGGFYPML